MPSYCTNCGARHADGDQFCSNCEAALGPGEDRLRPISEPPGHGPGWFVGLSVILALVVTAAIVGVNAWITQPGASPDPLAFPTSVYTDDSVVSEEPTQPTETSVPPTEEPVPTAEPTTATPVEPSVGNNVVAVAPDAAQNPAAADVVQVLTAYFTAVNQRDYNQYRAQHTRAVRNKMTRSEFTTGFRSTEDSQIMLLNLTPADDGRLIALVSFVSHQNAADGPSGQTCTSWTVGKFLETEGNALRIGKAPFGYSNYEAC